MVQGIKTVSFEEAVKVVKSGTQSLDQTLRCTSYTVNMNPVARFHHFLPFTFYFLLFIAYLRIVCE